MTKKWAHLFRTAGQLSIRVCLILSMMVPLILQGPIPASASTYGDVVISEVMYDSKSSTDMEWVELYNPGPSAVDIGGWVLTDDDTYPTLSGEGKCVIPAGTTISAGGFLIISKEDPGLTGAVQCTGSGSFIFGNSGDNIALFNSSGELVFGSLTLSFPDLAGTNVGDSIGLKNPMAGWSSANDDWAVETTSSTENTTEFAHDTHSAPNDGWVGNVTTYHNIIADGTVNEGTEWLAGEKLGTVDSVTYYVTWIADFLFVGMIGGGSDDKYNVLIDVDPLDKGSNNSGTTTDYCGATFPADGKPDYALQLYPGGIAKAKATSDGSGWEAWSPSDSGGNRGTNQAEFYIKKSDIGLTSSDPVALYLYACNNDSQVWSAWPPENPGWTGSQVLLTTRVRFDGTGNRRSPRDDAAHVGVQTLNADSTGEKSFLDGYAKLNVTTAGGGGCQVTIEVLANHLVSRYDGGVRRSYKITPNGSCTGLVADLTLKYEDGTLNAAPSELRGIVESGLQLYRWTGSSWNPEGGTVNTTDNTVTKTGVSTFSVWSFGTTSQQPNAVNLVSLTASSAPLWWAGSVLVGALGLLIGGMLSKKRLPRHHA